MDGRFEKENSTDKPVAKPDFPLPKVFDPSAISSLPTRRRTRETSAHQEAHFYRKDFTEAGSPVYDFYITTEDSESETQH